jgi:Ca2+-binding RTX toxin-like protein
MATVVTVPGASNTFITESYSLTNNLAIAQQIAAALALAKSGGTLFVQNYDQNPGTVPTGDVGELAVTTPGGANIAVGTGYSYVAIDQTVTGPVSVSGAASIFAGDQTLNLSLSGNILAAVGNGNDLIGLKAGGTYTVGLGDGNDTVYANGSGTIYGGSGAHLFIGDSAGGSNTFVSTGGADTVVGGAGTLTYIGGTGSATIFGGTGTETLFGGSGQTINYYDGNTTTAGATTLAAGSGPETINAGASKIGVQIAVGSGTDSIIGSSGNDVFFGGAGNATITGHGGSDVFVYGNDATHTGGTDIITDFSTSDTFRVVGYGANAAQNALNAATVAGGSTTVKLADNTTITFLNVSSPTTIHNQSFLS